MFPFSFLNFQIHLHKKNIKFYVILFFEKAHSEGLKLEQSAVDDPVLNSTGTESSRHSSDGSDAD